MTVLIKQYTKHCMVISEVHLKRDTDRELKLMTQKGLKNPIRQQERIPTFNRKKKTQVKQDSCFKGK